MWVASYHDFSRLKSPFYKTVILKGIEPSKIVSATPIEICPQKIAYASPCVTRKPGDFSGLFQNVCRISDIGKHVDTIR